MHRPALKHGCPPTNHALYGGLAVLVLCFSLVAQAETRVIHAGTALQLAIDQANPGDSLILQAGIHTGPIVIERPLFLLSDVGGIIDGGGTGRVVTIAAPDVTLRGLTIRHSGDSLATEDSGVFVTKDGHRALIENNQLEANLIGVYLKGPQDAKVLNNTIIGSTNPHVNDRGNGVQLWNTPGSVVDGNEIRFGRDGILANTSRDNVLSNNKFRDLRFAIHYMYTNDSTVRDNHSSGNHVGYALMYSKNIAIHNNVSDSDRDRGLFLNYTNESVISGNRIDGAEKCFFIYNANGNRVQGNYFNNCQIGIHFTAGSEGNDVFGNAFIANRTQVKYVGTRYIEWSLNGRGNFWSDNPAFDLDEDGIADQPYRPNDLVDQLVWRHPLAKLLLSSPAMQVLRWAQAEFPSLHPGGVTDSTPLMSAEQTEGSDNG
ncbi:MAG: nitrous oxide reductase family maturation protein NosD [Halioglobus sp.]